MGRPAIDWKTKLPLILDKIENDHFSASVAAWSCGVAASTLSEAMAKDVNIRNAVEQAKAKKFAHLVEAPLSRMAATPKSPHHFNAVRLIALTQGKEYGYSEKEQVASGPIVLNIGPAIQIFPGQERRLPDKSNEVVVDADGNGNGDAA